MSKICSAVHNIQINIYHVDKDTGVFLLFKCSVTYSVLDAASRLTEQLWLGVIQLWCVKDLLTVYLVQVQEAVEAHGGCVGEQTDTYLEAWV